jgi:RNAse (barnase) inhibitor barstar
MAVTGPGGLKLYTIEGLAFSTLEEFYDHFTERVIPGTAWGRNLDAFDDILDGGFGTPAKGFHFCWYHATLSRERLGYAETARQLTLKLRDCHSTAIDEVAHELRAALHGRGPTVFDWLVDIIRSHGDIRLELVGLDPAPVAGA